MAKQLLTFHDLATHLQVDRKTVYRLMETDPDFPTPSPIGRQKRWRVRDLDHYEELMQYKEVLIARGWIPPESEQDDGKGRDTKGNEGTSAKRPRLGPTRRPDRS